MDAVYFSLLECLKYPETVNQNPFWFTQYEEPGKPRFGRFFDNSRNIGGKQSIENILYFTLAIIQL